MAVIFAYTNRLRNVVDIRAAAEVLPSGLPAGPWAPRIQRISFWVMMPVGENDGFHLARVNRGDYQLAYIMNQISNLAPKGDYIIVDHDSKDPKYYIRTAKTTRSLKYSDLPVSIRRHLNGMLDNGLCHLCYGEFINPDSRFSLFDGNIEDFSFSGMPDSITSTTPPIAPPIVSMWAIGRGTYYAETIYHVAEPVGTRVAIEKDRDLIPPELLENPDSLGTPLYQFKSSGEMAFSHEYAEVLVDSRNSYRWLNFESGGLVTDQFVRALNPDLEAVPRDGSIWYGDFIVHSDRTITVVKEPLIDQYTSPLSVEEFTSLLVIGEDVGNRTVLRLRDREFPIGTREFCSGYRYLNRDDHVQEGDLMHTEDGKIVLAANVGKKLSENSSTIFRPIGKDGWGVLVRSQISDEMEVEWQVRDRGKVYIDWTPWDTTRDSDRLTEYERQYYTVYFRKKVPGFRKARRGDPNFPVPFGMTWVLVGEEVNERCLEIINGELRVARIGLNNRACFEPHIYLRPVINQYHMPLPFPSILSKCSPIVEYVGRFVGGNPMDLMPGGHQLVLSQHGMSFMPVSSHHLTTQDTPIGAFHPAVFKINGQEQIIYVTDRVDNDHLSGLVTQGIVSMLGAVQRHLPFLNVIPAAIPRDSVRREVRTIEL